MKLVNLTVLSDSSPAVAVKYIKYIFMFVSGCPKVDAGLRLYQAALVGDLVSMARSVAEGAEVNSSLSEEGGRTALIAAAVGVRKRRHNCKDNHNIKIMERHVQKNPDLCFFIWVVQTNGHEDDPVLVCFSCDLQGSLLACEFLLQNGANVNYRDLRGQGALHAAATAGHTG